MSSGQLLNSRNVTQAMRLARLHVACSALLHASGAVQAQPAVCPVAQPAASPVCHSLLLPPALLLSGLACITPPSLASWRASTSLSASSAPLTSPCPAAPRGACCCRRQRCATASRAMHGEARPGRGRQASQACSLTCVLAAGMLANAMSVYVTARRAPDARHTPCCTPPLEMRAASLICARLPASRHCTMLHSGATAASSAC